MALSNSREHSRFSVLAVIAIFARAAAAATPSQLYPDGGLTILSQNFLDGAQNNGSAAILVGQTGTYRKAEATCKLLGETLWDPDTQDFEAGLRTSLAYQVYLKSAIESGLYWVANRQGNNDSCRAINPQGKLSDLDCKREAPALCTQSAPVSTSNVADNSTRWWVQQTASKVQFTGYRDYHTWKFRGVRFADRPERFTYSRVKQYNETVQLQAIEAGADCVQPIGEVKSGSSEDCLFLNIWTPFLPPRDGARDGQLKPVMVYLYGGGLRTGSGKNPNTDGTNLASRGDVVVVSVNYRVGSVGFLAFNDSIHKGNYGVSDMVTGLEWVKKYIRYFGGDAARLTVFGESAGAMGAHLLLASPKAQGLFQRAIMQSDPTGHPVDNKFRWTQYTRPEVSYEDVTTKVLREAGCLNATDQVACVKRLDGFDLVNLTTNANQLVADGTYLVDPELNLSRPGYGSGVDVMTGFNRDETGVQVDEYPEKGTTLAKYFNKVASTFGLNSSFIQEVPRGPFIETDNATAATAESILNATLKITTDGTFLCFDLAKAYSGAKNGAFKSTYSFEFNRTYSPKGYTKDWCNAPRTAERPDGDPDKEYYKCHAGEQLIVFGNIRRAGQPDRDGLDVPFMQVAVDYWSAFARTGDPNPDKAYLEVRGHAQSLAQIEQTGRWERVDAEKPSLRLLQWNGGQIPFVQNEQCQALGVPLNVLEA